MLKSSFGGGQLLRRTLQAGFPKACGDWRRLVDDPEVHVVDLTTQAPKRLGVARLEKGQELLPDLAAQVEKVTEAFRGTGQDAHFHAIGFEIGNLERRTPGNPAERKVRGRALSASRFSNPRSSSSARVPENSDTCA
jgi:hypothetical protein